MRKILDWLNGLFGVYTLHRVHDVITVREGGETIRLRVDDDAMRMTQKILLVQKELQAVPDTASEAERQAAILHFAAALFGEEQAQALLAFYGGAADCVLLISSRAFSERIAPKINRAQRR